MGDGVEREAEGHAFDAAHYRRCLLQCHSPTTAELFYVAEESAACGRSTCSMLHNPAL